MFHVSRGTVRNLEKLPQLPDKGLLNKLRWQGTRNSISSERLSVFIDVLDEEIPVVSGRNYHIHYCRVRMLYERYKLRATEKVPSLRVIGFGKFKKLLKQQ